MRLVVTAVCFFSMLTCVAAMADTVLKYNVNASSGWVPYYIPHQDDKPGILGEIVPLLMATAQIDIQKHNLPPRRTNQAIENGDLDFDFVSPDWFPNHDLGELFVQSEPLMPIKEFIITTQANADAWTDINKIKGQRIGTVRGYYYHDTDQFTRVDFSSERELIKAISKNRVQAAISGDLPALYWAKELNMPISLAALHSDGYLVMRLRKEHAHLLPAINSAIKQLQQQGNVEQLIDKYTKAEVFQ
ncbi:substrate-binding periplasmic protein [Shewanella maritima]|nr:transporter substrate-binding domain-containing protein [Shewanella maritima]